MNDTKLAISTTTVDEINQHHRAAQSHATKALDHAKQAGELLLKVKATIGHGGWLRWLEENCEVSARQAQRYMGVAEGKPTPIRAIAKNDTVSHLPLPAEATADELEPWIGTPAFIPTPGRWMQARMDDDSVFFVIESKDNPGYFHLSKLYMPLGFEVRTSPDGVDQLIQTPYRGPEDGWIDGTKKPVLAIAVEAFLRHMGMDQPPKAG